MNIWIFNHYAIAPGQTGGTRHYDLSQKIVNIPGNKVTIFASSYNHQSMKETQEYGQKQVIEKIYNNVRFMWIKTSSYKKNGISRVFNMFIYSWRAYRYAKQSDEKPDFVIGSLVHPLAAVVGWMIARKKGCKFYFEERDLWPQTLIDLGKMSRYNPIIIFLSLVELFLYKKATRIIILFNKAIDYVKGRGINSDKVIYLPNGVDASRYDDNRVNLPIEHEETLEKLKNKFIAIFLGSHSLAGNLDVILDSAKNLKHRDEIHFLMVGNGPEKERLMNRKANEQIDNVTFLPSVPKEYVPSLLRKTNVGLMPMNDLPLYRWGISPNKLFDYMAASLPVILMCNIIDSPVELSGGGVVIKRDFVDNLVQTLSDMSCSKVEVESMGRKAKEYVLQEHSWDILSLKLLNIMQEDLEHQEKREKH